MTQVMNRLEEKYIVKERAESDVKKYGSVKKALRHLKAELEEMKSLWSMYSSDCLGHGITCTRLKISWIERMQPHFITTNSKHNQ